MFSLTASAQVSHLVSSTPTDVIQTGLAEVLGEVRLTKSNAPTGLAQTTIGGTINILYQGVVIDNTLASSPLTASVLNAAGELEYTDARGITVATVGGYSLAALSITVTNITGVGGQVTISIPAGVVIPADTTLSYIRVNGVRAQMTGIPLNTDVNASIQAQPSNSSTFTNVSQVRVARTNPGLVVDTDPHSYALCITDNSKPTLTIGEGFPGAFVQHVTGSATGLPGNPRPKFGATNNTQIHILTSEIPDNVDLTWPATVVAGVATLRLIDDTDSSDIVYEFTTTNQATSDLTTEEFDIMPTVEFDATSAVGAVTVQAQLYPPDSTTRPRPRFNDPLKNSPADELFTINKCVTYLLFPFLTNAAGSGFDSGVAIANTSKDNAAFGCPETGDDAICGATAQEGTVTWYGYPQNDQTVVLTATSPNVPAGGTWATSLSFTEGFAGFQGYVIAVCQFQYAHGFGFITGKYNSGTVYDVAEGFLALVIPDPAVTDKTLGVRRFASPSGIGGDTTSNSFNAGEVLGQ
jgi:hypothetical protein